MDESRLGPGDRVIVTDLRTGKAYFGHVLREIEENGKLMVEYDNGARVSVGRGFVKLYTPEGET